jgi:hypothetical protein
VKTACIALVLLSMAACNRGNQNKDAIRQAIIDRLNSRGLNVSGMNVDLTNVQFNGSQADATVAITPKGGPANAGMTMPYHLEQQNGKWVVTGSKQTGENPHGAGAIAPGVMPPAGDSPHGQMAPPPAGAEGKMPSPEDLPPAGKKK